MGNIVNDIVDDVVEYNEDKISPKKSKILIRIIIGISIVLIGLAFTIGQFRSTIVNKMESFETTLSTQTSSIEDFENELNVGFKDVHNRIDKVYDDGLNAFDDYQDFNKEQLILVLDYGQENKEMLKKMLELNSTKNRNDVETQIEKAKNENDYNETNGTIVAVPIKNNTPDYMELNYVVNEIGDTTFYLIGATMDYVDTINRNKYSIEELKKNPNYGDVYDVTYHTK